MKNALIKLRKNKKGFTLAELLIVVAIIAILVAISVPIFTAQLQKSKLATNKANARDAKSAAVTQYMADNSDNSTGAITYSYNIKSGDATVASAAGSNIITDTDIVNWNVKSQEDLGKATYNTWYITVSDQGTVTSISYQ